MQQGWGKAALGPVLGLRAPPAPHIQGRFLAPPPHAEPATLQGGLRSPSLRWTPGGYQGHGSLWRTHLHYSFLGIWGGNAGEMGRVSRDLPPLRTLPTFGIRQHESKMEGDLA